MFPELSNLFGGISGGPAGRKADWANNALAALDDCNGGLVAFIESEVCMNFGDWYAKGKKHYYAGEYKCAAECFQHAYSSAFSKFAKGEALWWLAGCKGTNHARLYNENNGFAELGARD